MPRTDMYKLPYDPVDRPVRLSVDALLNTIRSHPLLKDLSTISIDSLIADAERVTFAEGAVLMRQGEESDSAVLMFEGTVAITAQTRFGLVTLSELTGVQLLGDTGIYAHLPRSATVIARTRSTALRIGRAAMLRMCNDNPSVLLLTIQQLGARLNMFNQAIATYTNALSALDTAVKEPPIIETLLNPPPELTNFASAFGRMARLIHQQRQEREEMANASAIQNALLPLPLPNDVDDRFQLDAVMQPARHVGGDFFDIIRTRSDHIYMTIGDVSGKGVPASLFATVCQTVIRLVLSETIGLDRALNKANRLISSANRECMFATFIVADLNLATGALCYCNAGHLPPAILRADGSYESLVGGDLPLAAFDETTFTQHHASLATGDRIVLFTDGVVEALNARGERFGQSRLIGALAASARNANCVSSDLLAAVNTFSEGVEQFDDIAAVALLYTQQSIIPANP